jgi:LacI family transcriptional regulator
VLAANLPATLPTVLLNTRVAAGSYPAFAVDNYGGAAAMMRHLFASGRRRIAFISGPDDNFDADERLRGYRDAVAQHEGVREIVLRGDFSESSGYRAGIEICQGSERPDAIFAANDMMALGCLFALTEKGVAVPDAIALAGFDDIPIARFVTPPLTTVRVRIADLGRRAFERLDELIVAGDDGAKTTERLDCDLVVRQSTGGHDAVSPASGADTS